MAKIGKTATIKQTVRINASPEEVYEAYVNPKIHAKFTGSRATMVAKVGGRMTAWDGYISARNLKLKKGKLIVQEWKTTEWPAGQPASKLSIALTKKGNGTELRMVHSLVPASGVKDYTSGWKEFYWEPLKKYFARNK